MLKIILENRPELLEKLADYKLYIPANVLEEAAYKTIILICSDFFKTGKFYEIKERFEKERNIPNIKEKLHALNLLAEELEVLPVYKEIFDLAKKISLKYGLLPNDALIAATCKFYRIEHIATFDEDFERVKFLRVVKV